MDWNDYRREINAANFDLDSSLHAARYAVAVWQERKEMYSMKNVKRTLRLGTIAACMAVVLCLSALAVTVSWRQTIHENLGIENENSIPGYVEYDVGTEAADNNTETTENMTLLAAVYSNSQMDAFFTLSGVPEDQQIDIRNLDFCWKTDRYGIEKNPLTTLISKIDYDAENETTLVRVTVMGQDLDDSEAVNIGLVWHEEPEEDLFAGAENLPINEDGTVEGLEEFVDNVYTQVLPRYEHELGPVKVPVTESEILTAANTEVLSGGNITGIRVGTGFVEICLEGMGDFSDNPDAAHTAVQARMKAVTAALVDATIHFADGSEQNVAELASPWDSPWVFADGNPETGRVQHILSQMLDIRQVTAISIGDTVYELK